MNYAGKFDATQADAELSSDGLGVHSQGHVHIPSEHVVVIGHVQTAIGSGTLTREGGIAVELKVGDPVCQGDVIETAADGRLGIRFIDGTAFDLSGGARMVLEEFVCDASGTSHSALFGVTRGAFAFIAGQ